MRKADNIKTEKENKREIIIAAAKVVMDEVSHYLLAKDDKADLEIRIKAQRNNRYFNLHRYGEDLRILIYRSGDVDFQFKEFAHTEKTVRVIHYEDVIEDKEIMEQFHKDVELVMNCFLCHNWHVFMDYMCDMEEGSDWRDTVKAFITEFYDL